MGPRDSDLATEEIYRNVYPHSIIQLKTFLENKIE